MKIDILTLFPEMFTGFLTESILKKAIEKDLVEINLINFRDYSLDPHHKVDDTPYGGGAGMVLTCQPIYDAVEALKTETSKIILLTPDGKTYNQKLALDFKSEEHLIIICGHYEGFDDRIRLLADIELSIGDYILTGGEVAAMIIVDSVVRLIDGVINEESLISETFNDDLVDYPVYTKPREFRGLNVPEVLLNGNHKEIAKFRDDEKIKRTAKKNLNL